ncbi:MAG: inositol monophosphatase [Roseburia sp.]|nr:inositol monophosphatase [Roseburia sp.]
MVETEKLIEIIKSTKPFFENRAAAGDIKVKGRADYATQVDESVQRYLLDEFAKLYPEIGFLGEENYSGENVSGATWIVDPVDGTTNLIHDYRQSAVSVALAVDGQIVLGIIYNPYTDELYYAGAGKGAYKNGKKISVSAVCDMEHSLISIGTSPYYHEYAENNFEVFKKIFLQCEDIRRSGSAALDLARVAEGSCEAYFERNLKIWDYAAGMLLVEEAGGKVTDYAGTRIGTDVTVNDVVAGNFKLQEALLNILNK